MSRVREVRVEAVEEPRCGAPSGEPEASREVRWSARRKEQVVLRLLRGESLDLLARETGQPAGRIAGWREEFLEAGREGLKSRPAPEGDRASGGGAAQGRGAAARGRHPAGAVGEEGKPSVAEALEVSASLPAPLLTVCRVAGVSRSAAQEQRRRRRVSADAVPARRRPGPVGPLSDAELLAEIRRDLAESPFVGEGHRKVWARLRRQQGIRTSRKRVLRLTREAGLLAPTAQVRKRSARLHEGTITVEVPDTLWATDATEAWTRQEGRCALFVIVDHASNEVWYDAAPRMDRFAAADLLREVCTERFGSVERAVAAGLALRYDGGSCFRSDHYQAEIDHLGIARSPAFHYEPETNGCAEKAIEVLKEQVLWIERFDKLEELRQAVRRFGRLDNDQWLIERHGYRTPIEARAHLRTQAAAAA
jgi:putative transposase